MNAFLDQRVLDRIRAEYLEMPGMNLTAPQLQRLCGIDQAVCTLVLNALVKAQFLIFKSDGTYTRLTNDRSPVQRRVATMLP